MHIKYIHVPPPLPKKKKSLLSVLFFFLSNISFGHVKETSQGDVSFSHPNMLFSTVIKKITYILFSEFSVSQNLFRISEYWKIEVRIFDFSRFYCLISRGMAIWLPQCHQHCPYVKLPLLHNALSSLFVLKSFFSPSTMIFNNNIFSCWKKQYQRAFKIFCQ